MFPAYFADSYFPKRYFANLGGEIVEQAVERNAGGWEFPKTRRKTEEEKRKERIKLGILPPDPIEKPIEPVVTQVTRRPNTPSYALTPQEIERLKAKIKNEIDLEIAIHIQQREKKRKQVIALVLMLAA